MKWNKDFNGGYYSEAIQYQYYNSNIGAFLRGLSQINERYINQAIETAFNDIINLRTAVGAGLDMWGNVLGFPRYIPVEDDTPKDWKNFNFYDSYFKKLKFKNYSDVKFLGLPDFNYRMILLLLKAQQSITPNIKAIDMLVNEIFEKLKISVIVKDTQDMSWITYVFKQEIPEWLGWILKHYDILPRPAGVGATFIVDLKKPFSFDRYDLELNKEITNFYYGNFSDGNFDKNQNPDDGSGGGGSISDPNYISPTLLDLMNKIGEGFQRYNLETDPSKPPRFGKEGGVYFEDIFAKISNYVKNNKLSQQEIDMGQGIAQSADYYNSTLLQPSNLPLITPTDDGFFIMK